MMVSKLTQYRTKTQLLKFSKSIVAGVAALHHNKKMTQLIIKRE